jgi:mono/diheme cytochrome c family protein
MMRSWTRMRAFSGATAVVLIAGVTVAAQTASPPTDEHPALPPGPGRELMIRVCSTCHSPEVAAEQQLDSAGWKTLVDQMASKGANATEAEFDEIVRYLADAFPASK